MENKIERHKGKKYVYPNNEGWMIIYDNFAVECERSKHYEKETDSYYYIPKSKEMVGIENRFPYLNNLYFNVNDRISIGSINNYKNHQEKACIDDEYLITYNVDNGNITIKSIFIYSVKTFITGEEKTLLDYYNMLRNSNVSDTRVLDLRKDRDNKQVY